MTGVIFKKHFPFLPDYDIHEILRYLGCKNAEQSTMSLIESAISETDGSINANVCYITQSIAVENDTVDFSNAKITSKSLAKQLYGCDSAVIFAATIGLQADRLIMKYSSLIPSRAVILQAIGTERVEALCDEFCRYMDFELCKSNKLMTKRVSPGYGDISLEFQKDIFRILDCQKNIGAYLSDSLIMTPTKTVTAIAGIKKAD